MMIEIIKDRKSIEQILNTISITTETIKVETLD